MASFFSRILTSVGHTISAYTGEDGYTFGDVSRAAASRVGNAVLSYTGKDEYQFGDISRQTINKYFEWKEALQTPSIGDSVLGYTAKDRYVFGDVTLVTVRRFIDLFRNKPCCSTQEYTGYSRLSIETDSIDECDDKQTVSNSIKDTDELIEVFSRAFWSPNIPNVDIKCSRTKIHSDVIWQSFFDRAYELSFQCLNLGVLVLEDFSNLEPFMFIGLPSLVLVEAVHRSIDYEGIILATGIVVTAENCPGEITKLFHTIDRFKKNFSELGLNTHELCLLKLNLLFASACDKAPPAPIANHVEADRIVQINSISAEVSGVSILISQMPIFKDKFGRVLARVLEEVVEID